MCNAVQMNWMCIKCKYTNENFLKHCKMCKTVRYGKMDDDPLFKSINEIQIKPLNLFSLDLKKNDKVAEKPNLNHWTCNGCKHLNIITLEECFKCNSKKNAGDENLSSLAESAKTKEGDLWKCNKCLNMNSKTLSCSNCKSSKESNLSAVQNEENKNWICLPCNYSNTADKAICHNCDLPKGSSKIAWICSHCKKVNQTNSELCSNCSKPTSKLVKKKCGKCENLIYHPNIICDSCKGTLKGSEDFWECSSCRNKNEKSTLACKSCSKAMLEKNI
ncbi:hypothetical protein SteCoe_37591 [Stentor coeruleus]|uniref:RanBP2-type domain-containing protein n=1 Tax=Stentor coeruleus TaxID=5963 RepID=A0A1R2AMS3_9CILI|nr:hypothetical protein SteCoe_37591 [Stentor coeruleus]